MPVIAAASARLEPLVDQSIELERERRFRRQSLCVVEAEDHQHVVHTLRMVLTDYHVSGWHEGLASGRVGGRR